MKRLMLAALLVAVTMTIPAKANSFSIFQVNGAPVSALPTVFTHLQIGGAGLETGTSSVQSQNIMFTRTDQYGCYISVASAQWKQLLTTTAMPSGILTSATDGGPFAIGCDEVIGDNSSANNIWMAYYGNVFFSANQGALFNPTCYPTQTATGSNALNTEQKSFSPTLAVDPANSAVVYMSTPKSGLQVTFNQGSTCAQVTAVGTGGALSGHSSEFGGHLIAFDTSAGTISVSGQTRTKSIFVETYGAGVYHSNDGGQTWTLTSSGPTTGRYMAADLFGDLWFVDDSGVSSGHDWKYNGSTWADITSSVGNESVGVAVDGLNCSSAATCHIAFSTGAGPSGRTSFTATGGASWNWASNTPTITATDVPWLANFVTNLGFYTGGMAFDNAGNVCVGSEGYFCSTPQTSGSTATWSSRTAGVEEFETNTLSTSPGTPGALLISGWDVACFKLTAPYNTFPSSNTCPDATTITGSLLHAFYLDWAPNNTTTFVALNDNQTYGAGYSTHSGLSSNAGLTWGKFAAIPSTISTNGYPGGCMAAADTSHFMWAPTDGSGVTAPFVTADGANTWNQITITNGTATGGWPWEIYLNSRQCAADKVLTTTFYLYDWNMGDGNGDALLKCVVASCAIQSRPGFGPNEQYNPTIKTVYNQANYLFAAYGTFDPPTNQSGDALYYYPDGGVTKNTFTGITGVSAYGFGAPAPGHTFPAIYFAGWYNNVYGIYRSIDFDSAKTWQQIGTYPMGVAAPIMDIECDKSSFGVCYYGTDDGVFCGAISTLQCDGATWVLKRDLDPASNDNSAAFLDQAA